MERSCIADSPKNTPRQSGSGCGERSPIRYGRYKSPPAPGFTCSANLSMMIYGSTPCFWASSTSCLQQVSRSHFKDSPAPWVQLITVHLPGTEAQRVCTRPFGSIETLSETAYTTPEVPIVVNAFPSRTIPVPTAAAALSPAPPTTTVPSARPVNSAAFAWTVPVTSGDS